MPIYKRVEEVIRRKEQKIKQIQEKNEIEKKLKNAMDGIMDEEEIIEVKKQKDSQLKGKFSLSLFEQRYERQIKQLLEKQKRREQEKQ